MSFDDLISDFAAKKKRRYILLNNQNKTTKLGQKVTEQYSNFPFLEFYNSFSGSKLEREKKKMNNICVQCKTTLVYIQHNGQPFKWCNIKPTPNLHLFTKHEKDAALL